MPHLGRSNGTPSGASEPLALSLNESVCQLLHRDGKKSFMNHGTRHDPVPVRSCHVQDVVRTCKPGLARQLCEPHAVMTVDALLPSSPTILDGG
jgi:hypothetical protein